MEQTCFPILLCATVLLLQGYTASLTNITTDQSALLALKARISYDPRSVLTNWSITTSVCNWIGITCGSRHHRVIALDLSNMSLLGTIPPHIGNLSFLVSLRMRNNSFHGSLPSELAHLYRLKFLSFGFNNFNEKFPSWMGLLTKLQYLYLHHNSFMGTIPPSLSNISSLRILSLSTNNFSGRVPLQIGELIMLTELHLDDNNFEGSIPSIIFNLSSLQVIDLSSNKLSGGLPTDMFDRLPNLQWVSVSDNQFYGELPSTLFKCKQLQILSLSINNFSGRVPPQIGNLTMLTELYLGYNNFGGAIPNEIGNLQSLQFLGGDGNSFSGLIPREIFNISTIHYISMVLNKLSGHLPSDIGLFLPNLQGLFLTGNEVSGIIPSSISNASQLTGLDLQENSFSGFIPKTLGNLRLLQYLNFDINNLTVESRELRSLFSDLSNCIFLIELDFSTNPLNAILPISVGNLSTSLQIFRLHDCQIKGSIPIDVGKLSNLILLDLSINELAGPIPITIGRLRGLQALYLEDNRLEGPIPSDLCRLNNLFSLYLERNKLSRPIPECINYLTFLRKLYLGFNQLTSTIPMSLWSLTNLLELHLSSNYFSGSLSLEIGNMKVLRVLDISGNQLSGDIPKIIGGLKDLVNLSLADNQFEGSIPESFGELVSLVLLNLSRNNLSGEIPKSLEAIQYLKYLNVSFNRLRGEIPTGGPFVNFSAGSFLSNDALCGAPQLQVFPCEEGPHRPQNITALHILKYVLPIIGLIVLAVSLVLVRKIWKKKNAKSPVEAELSPLATWKRISHLELQQATEGFSPNNLLGKGSYGVVYKGTLSDGMNVAIKVLNLEVEGAFRSFDVECAVLRNIRHRNLVKIISACSSTNFKALVLDYMPNGNLETWLYSNDHCLNMLQRLDIMIDVATALEYLHSSLSTPIIHCDLKPSNVLLDAEMVAHVADFSIAKLLGDEDSLTRTTTLASIGYMAPEYGSKGIISTRGDVYSYGILLMEIFTRKKPTDEMFAGEMNLKRWVEESLSRSANEVVDANLLRNEGYSAAMDDYLSSTMGLALSCCADSPEHRIDIKIVSFTLNKIRSKFLQD